MPQGNLNVGDRIFIPTLNLHGHLRFIGEAEFKEGLWAGIELDEPLGKNSGSVKGVTYFTCKENHGLFIHPNRLVKVTASNTQLNASSKSLPRLPSSPSLSSSAERLNARANSSTSGIKAPSSISKSRNGSRESLTLRSPSVGTSASDTPSKIRRIPAPSPAASTGLPSLTGIANSAASMQATRRASRNVESQGSSSSLPPNATPTRSNINPALQNPSPGDRYQAQLDVLESRNNLLSIELAQTRTQLDTVQSQSGLLHAQLLDSESENHDLKARYEWIKAEMDKLMMEIETLRHQKQEMSGVEHDIEIIQGSLDSLIKEKSALELENQELRQASANITLQPAVIESTPSAEQIEEISKICADSQSEVAILKQKLVDCAFQLEKEHNQYVEAQAKFDLVHNQLTGYEQATGKLQGIIVDLEEKLKVAIEEKSNAHLGRETELLQLLAGKESEIAQLSSRILEHEERQAMLSKNVAALQIKVDSSVVQHADCDSRIDSLESSLKLKKDEFKALQELFEAAKAKETQLLSTIADIQSQLESCQQTNLSLSSLHHEELSSKIADLEKRSNIEVAKMRSKLSDAENITNQLKSTIAALEKQLTESRDEQLSLAGDHEHKVKTIMAQRELQVREELERLHNARVSELEAEFKTAREEVERIFMEEEARAHDEREELKKKGSEVQLQIDELKMRHRAEADALELASKTRVEALANKCAESDAALVDLENKLTAEHNAKVAEYEKQIKTIGAEHARVIDQLKRSSIAQSDANSMVLNAMDTLAKEHESQMNAAVAKTRTHYESLISQMQEELMKMKEDFQKSAEDSHGALMAAKDVELNNMQGTIADLTKTLTVKESKLDEIDMLVKKLKQAHEEDSAVIAQLSAEKDSLQAELEIILAENAVNDRKQTDENPNTLECLICETEGDHSTETCPKVKFCENCESHEHTTDECPDADETY